MTRTVLVCSVLAVLVVLSLPGPLGADDAGTTAAPATPPPAPAPVQSGGPPLSPAATAPATAEDASVLAAARAADGVYQRHLQSLATSLTSQDQAVRIKTLGEYRRLLDPTVVPLLLPFLDPTAHAPVEIEAAIRALSDLGAEQIAGTLRKLLASKDPALRASAYNGLDHLRAIGAGDYKGRALDTVDGLRGSALTNLGTMAQADAAPLLRQALDQDPDPRIRRMCAIGLGRLGDVSNGQSLINALNDPDPDVRRCAAEALTRLKDTAAIPYLLMALEANVAGHGINRCLVILSGHDFGFDERDDAIARGDAIEKGFRWWTLNGASLH